MAEPVRFLGRQSRSHPQTAGTVYPLPLLIGTPPSSRTDNAAIPHPR